MCCLWPCLRLKPFEFFAVIALNSQTEFGPLSSTGKKKNPIELPPLQQFLGWNCSNTTKTDCCSPLIPPPSEVCFEMWRGLVELCTVPPPALPLCCFLN